MLEIKNKIEVLKIHRSNVNLNYICSIIKSSFNGINIGLALIPLQPDPV